MLSGNCDACTDMDVDPELAHSDIQGAIIPLGLCSQDVDSTRYHDLRFGRWVHYQLMSYFPSPKKHVFLIKNYIRREKTE